MGHQLLPTRVFSAAIFGKGDGAARGGGVDRDAPLGDVGTHVPAYGMVFREKAAAGEGRFQAGTGRMGSRIDFIMFAQAGKAAAAVR